MNKAMNEVITKSVLNNRFIGESESHSTSTPGVDSHSSNPPPQVLYQENTQHQHKKFWIVEYFMMMFYD